LTHRFAHFDRKTQVLMETTDHTDRCSVTALVERGDVDMTGSVEAHWSFHGSAALEEWRRNGRVGSFPYDGQNCAVGCCACCHCTCRSHDD